MGAAVSTHSRLKAAGFPDILACNKMGVSTHSRLKAAGLDKRKFNAHELTVSTHSRLKAAGLGRRVACWH